MKTNAVLTVVFLLAASAAVADESEGIGSTYFGEQYAAPDARSEGMGLAFTAVAEGPAGLYWNPATQLVGRTVAVGYHRADQVSDDLDFTAFGAAIEVGYLRLGGYQNELSIDDMPMGTALDPERRGAWKSLVRAGGLALDVGRLMFGDETTLFAGAGVSFKSFENTWAGTTQAKAADTDMGAIIGARHFLGDSDDVHRGWVGGRLGCVLTNTDRAVIEFPQGSPSDESGSFRLQQRGRAGLALEGRHGWHYRLGHRLRWLIAADWEKAKLDDGWSDETLSRYGAEVTLLGLVSGRIGLADQGEGSARNGTTYGGGLRFFPRGSRIGFRGDWASVPGLPDTDAKSSTSDGERRLARYSAAIWLDF